MFLARVRVRLSFYVREVARDSVADSLGIGWSATLSGPAPVLFLTPALFPNEAATRGEGRGDRGQGALGWCNPPIRRQHQRAVACEKRRPYVLLR
jgi:hypothetical protein